MGWESFDLTFDPSFNVKRAYNSLSIDPRDLQCETKL